VRPMGKSFSFLKSEPFNAFLRRVCPRRYGSKRALRRYVMQRRGNVSEVVKQAAQACDVVTVVRSNAPKGRATRRHAYTQTVTLHHGMTVHVERRRGEAGQRKTGSDSRATHQPNTVPPEENGENTSPRVALRGKPLEAGGRIVRPHGEASPAAGRHAGRPPRGRSSRLYGAIQREQDAATPVPAPSRLPPSSACHGVQRLREEALFAFYAKRRGRRRACCCCGAQPAQSPAREKYVVAKQAQHRREQRRQKRG